jgi:FdhD protein
MDDNSKRMIELKRFYEDKSEYMTDVVVREISMELFVNKRRLLSFSALPEYLEELALGFLFSEAIIHDESEILQIDCLNSDYQIHVSANIPQQRFNHFLQNREKTSGCSAGFSTFLSGKREKFTELTVEREVILNAMSELQQKSDLFRETGGVHSAALLSEGRLKCIMNDIGRHNAIDKVAGFFLKQQKTLSECALLTTGRVSSEIVKKAVRLGIQLLISHAAPTSEAIRLAWEHKLYLIGFARTRRFNLYTGFNQINIK